MIYTVITLLTIAILLFILSFFMNDKFKQLENQIEQISIASIQESYQLKKKIKILEEELLTEDITYTELIKASNNKTPLVRKIIDLYQQGTPIPEIAKLTKLSDYDVHSIVKQFSKES